MNKIFSIEGFSILIVLGFIFLTGLGIKNVAHKNWMSVLLVFALILGIYLWLDFSFHGKLYQKIYPNYGQKANESTKKKN